VDEDSARDPISSIIPFKDKRWDFDSDDADPHVFKVDQKTLLSWEKVQHEVNLAHPRTYHKKRYSLWPICTTNVGCLCCKRSLHTSDLAQYGTGVVLFFQFLKYMSVVFFFLTVLAIPQMVLSVSFKVNLQKTWSTSHYKGTLRLLTLGNFETQRK